MHVAICSDGVFPASMGGIERHTRLLVESLAVGRPELRLTVLHTHPGTRFFANLANVAEIAVDPKPGRRQYLLECLDLSERFADELRKLPDALIYSQGVCVLRGIRQFASRLIVNPHGLESFQTQGLRDWVTTTPFRIVQRPTFRHARCVVSLGGRLTKILEREVGDPRRIAVLPNGVNLPAEQGQRAPRGDGPLRLLFVGRLARNKGVPDLVRAMEILDRQGAGGSVHLDLAGAGPLLAELSGACKLPNVRFWGKVTDEQLEALYRQAHVFVLPTLFEGMPTVVLEAMARSLPVLVTDVGATTELVDDANGQIIAKSDPAALAGVLGEFADLPAASLARLGESGLQRVRTRFTWPQVADGHFALLSRMKGEIDQR